MDETCNSRTLTWLVKSCRPNPNTETRRKTVLLTRLSDHHPPENRPQNHHLDPSPFSSLPDDLLLECLSRVSHSSLPSVSLVCRRWSRTVDSQAFYDLRRALGRLRHTVYAVAVSDYGIFSATHCIGSAAPWKTSPLPGIEALPPEICDGSFSHARMLAIGRQIYVLGRYSTVRCDAWTGSVSSRSPMLFPRKKFAAAAVDGKIYVCGGTARTAAVEEYNPAGDTWRVVTESPRRRYGCVGAAVDGVLYMIGGLKIGGRGETTRGGRMEAHVYANSMDLYDVKMGTWLKSRHVPGGGCVVAACSAGAQVYVLASHAVELSFWRCEGRRGSAGFGEWCRLRSPPVPAQVRLDGAVRFCCVGIGETKVALVQVFGCIDDLLRRSGRSARGLKEGLVLVYDSGLGDWSRGPNLPDFFHRSACVSVEC